MQKSEYLMHKKSIYDDQQPPLNSFPTPLCTESVHKLPTLATQFTMFLPHVFDKNRGISPEETPIKPATELIKPKDQQQITTNNHKCQRCEFSTDDWSSQ
jgi:hypothetical protein